MRRIGDKALWHDHDRSPPAGSAANSDLMIGLAPPRYRNAEQKCDKQARERRFPGNGADGRERLSWLPRSRNGVA
jgi:hypothetical protein